MTVVPGPTRPARQYGLPVEVPWLGSCWPVEMPEVLAESAELALAGWFRLEWCWVVRGQERSSVLFQAEPLPDLSQSHPVLLAFSPSDRLRALR